MNETLIFAAAAETPIHCQGCKQRINRVLLLLDGVSHVAASAGTQQVRVDFDPARTTPEQMRAKLELAGFTVQPESRHDDRDYSPAALGR